ncbi:hypothetical protein HEP86_23195 [Streptomyces sp. RPA4-5]|nr:hypothetical protein HEP86_23195 [Streptomyces sp. RPA4-5]
MQIPAHREPYEPALEKGQVDVLPEYASTLAEFRNAKKTLFRLISKVGGERLKSADVAQAYAECGNLVKK